jgi:hypothetical protein
MSCLVGLNTSDRSGTLEIFNWQNCGWRETFILSEAVLPQSTSRYKYRQVSPDGAVWEQVREMYFKFYKLICPYFFQAYVY